MVPDVTQQLNAIKQTMAKTIVPAIEEGFAQEQASLILASLDWLLDVHGSQHGYELVELADQRELLEAMLRLDTSEDSVETLTDAKELLEEAAAPGSDLVALHTQTLRLKLMVERVFVTLSADPAPANRQQCVVLLDRFGLRQLERERAWFRMTGFPIGADKDVATVVSQQSRS